MIQHEEKEAKHERDKGPSVLVKRDLASIAIMGICFSRF